MLDIAIAAWPTGAHAAPSPDIAAVKTFPDRVNRTHCGAAPDAATCAVAPPAAFRYWKDNPLPGDTIIAALAAPAPTPSRIITPAFVHACTLSIAATRATMAPSPASA